MADNLEMIALTIASIQYMCDDCYTESLMYEIMIENRLWSISFLNLMHYSSVIKTHFYEPW